MMIQLRRAATTAGTTGAGLYSSAANTSSVSRRRATRANTQRVCSAPSLPYDTGASTSTLSLRRHNNAQVDDYALTLSMGEPVGLITYYY